MSPAHGSYDVVVIGSGPNGLAAAIVAARRGLSTVVFESRHTIGGGVRSAELTLPGFVHDVCSSVHPMAAASPFFRELPLSAHGLEWITPRVAVAHPLDGGDAVLLHNDLERTADELGADRARYLAGVGALARRWSDIEADVLAPLRFPQHPVSFARFAVPALLPAQAYARLAFSTVRARALFAGCAAHSMVPLSYAGSAAIALALAAVGHAHGWPIARGGSQSITNALEAHLRSLGGEIVTGIAVKDREQLPNAQQILFDTSPRVMAEILGHRLPARYSRTLRQYRHGPGVFKIDWALSAPIPWQARACQDAATVHVGGTLEEIAESEAGPWREECAKRPFVLVTQPSIFDRSRAPGSGHTAWGYCHVPNGSTEDMTERIEAQVERFAPGFREVIKARATQSPATFERENANLVGGDIGGGANVLPNLLFRPTWRTYRTPVRGFYLCSAATPPGAGVHGMCGYHAALRALGPELQ